MTISFCELPKHRNSAMIRRKRRTIGELPAHSLKTLVQTGSFKIYVSNPCSGEVLLFPFVTCFSLWYIVPLTVENCFLESKFGSGS
jgi:hypothetical protein